MEVLASGDTANDVLSGEDAGDKSCDRGTSDGTGLPLCKALNRSSRSLSVMTGDVGESASEVRLLGAKIVCASLELESVYVGATDRRWSSIKP